ncbi:hypothetical protein HDK64DRAFT_339453 [Phyllosticta capitalensis]
MPKVSTVGGGGRPPRKPYYKPPDKGHYNELPSLPNWQARCLRCGHGVHGEGHLTCRRKCHHCRTFNHIGFKCPEKGDNFYKRYAGRSAGEREEPATAMAPPPKPHHLPDKRNTSERRPSPRGYSTHSAERNTSERRPSPRGNSTHSRRHESRQDDSRSRRRNNGHDRSRSRSRSLSPSHRSLLEILDITLALAHLRDVREDITAAPARHLDERRSSEQRLDLPANHEEPQVKDEPSNSAEPQVKDESSESEEPEVKVEPRDSEELPVKAEPSGADADEKM